MKIKLRIVYIGHTFQCRKRFFGAKLKLSLLFNFTSLLITTSLKDASSH